MNEFNVEMTLDEIKHAELRILQHFKEFCERHSINYFISNGTLLGAIKYGGFIPWDDDIDVFVPRQEYERLIELYEDSEKYVLFSYERNKNFYFPFAKLCDMETLKIENGVDNGTVMGLDIDIFPLDYWGGSVAESKKKLRKMKNNLTKLSLSKMKFSKNIISNIIKWPIIFLFRSIGSSRYTRKMIHMASRVTSKDIGFSGCVVWPIYGDKEIVPSTVFEKTTEVVFEGGHFPAPTGYDMYLRSLYGDYKNDPPEDKQCTHHNFKAYK